MPPILTVTATVLAATFSCLAKNFFTSSPLAKLIRLASRRFRLSSAFLKLVLPNKDLARSTFFFRPLEYDVIQGRFEDYRNYFQTYQSISFYDTKRIRRIDLNRLDLLNTGAPAHVFDAALKTSEPIMHFDLSNPLRPAVHVCYSHSKKR